ncbi:LysR family transcriptional regulator [Sinirhodobacter populi]|uniref:LysR family transcriptional regulator n=1 Tax=Paenirhodobacter populi TaxID=2306993 RepID=A0A443K2H2_9RHOB|nr:LysR family transcriptional regulator [Sinirhodobacter populi]RWR26971.1 LysR family transcriptional regulator [Sinirhodobacter populi]
MACAQGVTDIGDRADKNGSSDRDSRPVYRLPKRRNMPSLGAFATFEVAAKHLSFTQAASELNVTQAAISQQIRGLEKALDRRLFLRKYNGMELTFEGQMLLEAVTQGLDRLSEAIFRIGQSGGSQTLTIAGTYAGVSNFIKPIADDFRRTNPDVGFTLLASDENDRLQDFDEVDLAVICGHGRSEIGPNLIALFPEVVEPVCSPAYLAAHGPFVSPTDLAHADLMELHRMHWSSDAIAWYPLTWRDWFRKHAPEVDEIPQDFVSNSYGLLVDAAEEGQGVILGFRHLVHQAVTEGRLVRIFDRPLNAGRTYYLKINPRTGKHPNVRAFVTYLLDAIEDIPMLKR